MEVKIQTLTPLWTGGVDGSMDRIHETGIIGSMRWWYEAIVRGLGGIACDPSKARCIFNAEKYRQSTAIDEHRRLRDAGLCDVCQIFGATGWKRRFLISIVDRTKPVWTQESRMLNIRPPDRSRGWFLPPGRMGRLVLSFTGDERSLNILASMLIFLEEWGSLGAKPQLGYGVFKIVNRNEVVTRAARFQWHTIGSSSPDKDLPDFRRFGFFLYHFKPEKSIWWTRVPGVERVATQVQPLATIHKTVPLAPALKNEWRFHQWPGSFGDQKWMFGTLQWRDNDGSRRLKSKIAVSWAYSLGDYWEARGWVWLQKPPIENVVWDLLRDNTAWQNSIQVPGSLETHPAGKWCKWITEDVAKFLEETK